MSPWLLTLSLFVTAAGQDVSQQAIVVFEGGELTAAEVERWLEFRPPRGDSREALRTRLDELALLRLTERDLALGSRETTFAIAQRLLEERLQSRLYRQHLRRAVRPTEEEIEAAFREDPRRFDQPRRWQLQNYLRRYPAGADASAREQVREAVRELRAEIVAGVVTFEDAARSSSESTTSARGGNLGTAPLERLHPEVAKVVATLGPGDVSALIETDEGVSLLRCVKVLDPKKLTAEASRARHRERLWNRAYEAAERELEEKVQRTAAQQRARGDSKVGAARTGTAQTETAQTETAQTESHSGDGDEVSHKELEVFIALNGGAALQAPQGPAAERGAGLPALLLVREQAARARELDLTSNSAGYQSTIEWEKRRARMNLALEEAVSDTLEPVTRDELERSFRRFGAQFQTRPIVHLDTLVLPIEPNGIPKQVYDDFRALPKRLREGLDFEAATRELAPWVSRERWGELSDRDVWRRGLNIEQAVESLVPGEVSGVEQEGQKLFIVRLVSRVEGRPMTFDEARPALQAHLEKVRTRRAIAKRSVEMLDAANVRVVAWP